MVAHDLPTDCAKGSSGATEQNCRIMDCAPSSLVIQSRCRPFLAQRIELPLSTVVRRRDYLEFHLPLPIMPEIWVLAGTRPPWRFWTHLHSLRSRKRKHSDSKMNAPVEMICETGTRRTASETEWHHAALPTTFYTEAKQGHTRIIATTHTQQRELGGACVFHPVPICCAGAGNEKERRIFSCRPNIVGRTTSGCIFMQTMCI